MQEQDSRFSDAAVCSLWYCIATYRLAWLCLGSLDTRPNPHGRDWGKTLPRSVLSAGMPLSVLMRERTSIQPTSIQVRLITGSEYTVEHKNFVNCSTWSLGTHALSYIFLASFPGWGKALFPTPAWPGNEASGFLTDSILTYFSSNLVIGYMTLMIPIFPSTSMEFP